MNGEPDYLLVRTLQGQVADRTTAAKQARETGGQPALTPADERQLALSLTRDVVARHRRAEITAGVELPGAAQDADLVEAIDAAMFGAGALQELPDYSCPSGGPQVTLFSAAPEIRPGHPPPCPRCPGKTPAPIKLETP